MSEAHRGGGWRRPVWSLWPTGPTVFLAIALFVLTLVLFAIVVITDRLSDIHRHAEFVAQSTRTGVWLAEFLFFGLVAVCAGFTTNKSALLGVTAVLLAAAVAAKFLVSRTIAFRWLELERSTLTDAQRRATTNLLLAALFLLPFLFSLPTHGWTGNRYIGQFPPNVWHNSTTIFLMPFALGLLWTSYRYLEVPTRKMLIATTILAVLNLAAKPSFFLTFIVAFPALVLWRNRLRRPTWETAAAMLIPVACLGLQYWHTFHHDVTAVLYKSSELSKDHGGIEWKPFHVWDVYSKRKIVSLVASLLFPLTVLALHARLALRSLLYQYVLLNLVLGLAIYILLSETGARRYHANFSWQVIIANYMLFLTSIMVVFRAWTAPGAMVRRRDWIIVAAFGLHLVAGLIYVVRWFSTNNFL